MKNYTWAITSLYTLDVDSETDYVVTATYDILGTETVDGVEYTGSLAGGESFEVTEGSEFIPYADLTNEVVAGWVKEKLGEILVSNLEASVGAEIDLKVTPPTVPTKTALPWA